MSVNNVYVIKEHNGFWFGWDVCAEKTVADHEDNNGVRVLSYSNAPYYNEDRKELIRDMNAESYLGSEYGIVTDELPKDGTPIKFID
jgi:hypothetical protein